MRIPVLTQESDGVECLRMLDARDAPEEVCGCFVLLEGEAQPAAAVVES